MATNDFHDGLDVCVGNWGYYSEGILRDKYRGNGELLSCFDFNRYGEITENSGHVDLCETCYVDKGGDWPLLDEYPFGEIRDETVDAWRSRVAKGAVKKPAMPSEIAYAASAIAALSADGEDGGVHTAKL